MVKDWIIKHWSKCPFSVAGFFWGVAGLTT